MKTEKLEFKHLPYEDTIIEWSCPHCKSKQKSCSWESHKLDMCKCKKSGVDLEEHYCRILGDAKITKEKNHSAILNNSNSLEQNKKKS
jgi:Zn ribbon nucleic-acid-binding protein